MGVHTEVLALAAPKLSSCRVAAAAVAVDCIGVEEAWMHACHMSRTEVGAWIETGGGKLRGWQIRTLAETPRYRNFRLDR